MTPEAPDRREASPPNPQQERVPVATGGGDLLGAVGLKKSFGETRALSDGTLAVRPGEVVALMGENGSGKSTLVKILSGVFRPDAGHLEIDGEPVRFAGPRAAMAHGIATVFQDILVAPALDVTDNVCLGSGPLKGTRAAKAARRERAGATIERLSPVPIDLDAPVRTLGLMERQICVLARAIARRPRVLILDEATSTLDIPARDRLFETVRGLCAEGTGVFFISHRMTEVMSLADRVTVLRSGSAVGTVACEESSADAVVKMMSGEGAAIERVGRGREARTGAPILITEKLKVAAATSPIDLEVAAGEIVGLAGLEGQGQEEFLEILAGILKPADGKVEHRIGGRGRKIDSYRRAVREGIVYIPRDRKTEGLAGALTTVDNFAMPTYSRDGKLGFFRLAKTMRRYETFRDRLALKAQPHRPVARLSGGNQQKVVLARWLATGPDIVLLNDPTRGVDQATKHEIYDLLEELSDAGTAVVMVSTEVEEHLALMDRVLVFRAGGVTAEFSRGGTDRDSLIASFFGRTLGTGAPAVEVTPAGGGR